MIKIGQVGPGTPWDEGGKTKISRIFIFHGLQVYSLQFQYAENGAFVLSEKHGCDSGPKFDVVTLDHDKEHITAVSGTRNYFGVTSIAFTTNKKTYGPFGIVSRRSFDYKAGLGFAGFYGSASKENLNSIGVYVDFNKA